MNFLKKYYQRFMYDGLAGLAIGLFATVVAGNMLETIGLIMGGDIGQFIAMVSKVVKLLVGIAIGVGVATKLGASPCVVVCAAVTGYIGAYAYDIMNGVHFVEGNININKSGEPLVAFLASYVTVEIGCLIANRTKLNYLITPIIAITIGAVVSFYVATPIHKVTQMYKNLIVWATGQNEVVMSILVAVLMGLAMTLPISTVALAMSINMTGSMAAAAAIGCCVSMIGYATASFRDNKIEGFILQGLGISAIQMPNIIKNPLICIPTLITSAVVSPIAVCVLNMTCDSAAAGLGSCGFISQILTYQTMVNDGISKNIVLIEILLIQLLIPAVATWFISEFMRKHNFIKEGDMKISF